MSYIMKFQWASLFLVLLSAAVMVHSQTDFVTKHIRMGQINCNDEMKVVNNIHNKNRHTECKPVNTFILQSEEVVNGLCIDYNDQTITSPDTFTVIECRTDPQTHPPNCTYTGSPLSQYITVVCKNGKPVHYQVELGVIQRFCGRL
uniref:Ribonuclease A-domain domain-containing protein n=1 Tax=Esox lucius TaxID=8010 RepID=A0AAY5L3W8_ESOLU